MFRGIRVFRSQENPHPCGLLLNLMPMSDSEGLSQLLKETEHFRRWCQKEVAKVVHCGEHYLITTKRPPGKVALVL
jgi:hypothetical protein